MKVVALTLFALLFVAAPASASERSVAGKVLSVQSKSFKNFSKAKLSVGFEEQMGPEITCVENIISGVEKSTAMSDDEKLGSLLTILVLFPFDYTIAASQDQRNLVKREAIRLLIAGKQFKTSSAKERLLVSSLGAQRKAMLILSRLQGDIDFCAIETEIAGDYTPEKVNPVFESALENSWAPQLIASKTFERASKKVQKALSLMEKMRPRFPGKVLDKFSYPPSFGLAYAWEGQPRLLSLQVVPRSGLVNPPLFGIPASRDNN